jgi:hypothetical protein
MVFCRFASMLIDYKAACMVSIELSHSAPITLHSSRSAPLKFPQIFDGAIERLQLLAEGKSNLL